MTKVAILQSNYIPWRGYFDLLRSADIFVLYDEVQYTKNDWRNRNRIVGKSGPHWLTIPIQLSKNFGMPISDAKIADPRWAKKHFSALRAAYGRSAFFVDLLPVIERLYFQAQETAYLSVLNQSLIRELSEILGISTTIIDSRSYPVNPSMQGRSERLLDICLQCGARIYVSGPSAQSYLDVGMFKEAGIEIEWFKYPPYPSYLSSDGNNHANASILDTLFHLGPDSVFTSASTLGH